MVPEGPSSARIRLVAAREGTEQALQTVREVAEEKDLRLIEPLTEAEP